MQNAGRSWTITLSCSACGKCNSKNFCLLPVLLHRSAFSHWVLLCHYIFGAYIVLLEIHHWLSSGTTTETAVWFPENPIAVLSVDIKIRYFISAKNHVSSANCFIRHNVYSSWYCQVHCYFRVWFLEPCFLQQGMHIKKILLIALTCELYSSSAIMRLLNLDG